MTANCEGIVGRRRGEDGSILVMTAIMMVGLFLALGLAIDVSRVYAVRADLQNAADAAALAAARELNSGSGGINDAVTRANAIANSFGPERSPITVANVQFAVNRDGPYVNQAAAAAAPTTIRFVQVTTQAVDVPILFAVRALGNTDAETGQAVAGMSVGLTGICDFFPIAVALTNPNVAPNTTMLLNFTNGTGSSATLADRDYIILEVPDITGNGAPETAVLSAGLTSICKNLNEDINFNMTPSANQNNGPRQIKDGVDTRFDVSPINGYGNALNDTTTFPPDTNVRENITFDQYINRTAVTPPTNRTPPGQDDRRIVLVPIVAPGTYSPPRTQIVKWGAFFLKRRIINNNPCSVSGNCGVIEVEWIDERLVIGRGTSTGGSASSLTVAVLYQ